jgi:hypothetical protein
MAYHHFGIDGDSLERLHVLMIPHRFMLRVAFGWLKLIG